MSDDDFSDGKRPTVTAVKAVWDEVKRSGKRPNGRLVAELIERRGGKIGHATVARYKKDGWIEKGTTERKIAVAQKRTDNGTVIGISPEVQARADEIEKMVGKPLTASEITQVEIDLKELKGKTVEDLKAIEQQDLIIYRIMMLRFSQRRIDALILVPRDSAAMVTALTEAHGTLNTIPAAKMSGDMIDVTPNESPMASALQLFQRKRAAG